MAAEGDGGRRIPCIWVVISNWHDKIPKAFRGAEWLAARLPHARGLPAEHVVPLLDKTVDEIRQGLQDAAEYMAIQQVQLLFAYYAGHACAPDTGWIEVEPLPEGPRMDLTLEVEKAITDKGLLGIDATVFVDGCRKQAYATTAEASDVEVDPTNKVRSISCAEFGAGVWDGSIFVKVLHHCVQFPFNDVHYFCNCVQELAKQLSFKGLCSQHVDQPQELAPIPGFEWPLTVQQSLRGGTSFLRFALHFWVEDFLASGSVQDAVRIVRRVVELLDTRGLWFEEDPWLELKVISKAGTLTQFRDVLEAMETRAAAPSAHAGDLVPDAVRQHVVKALQHRVIPQAADPVGEMSTLQHVLTESTPVIEDLKYLWPTFSKWFEKYESSQVVAEEGAAKHVRFNFLKVSGVCAERFLEGERKETAAQIADLCKKFRIPGHVYLAEGSLWLVFCTPEALRPDQQRAFKEEFGRWVAERRGRARGWLRAQEVSWKPRQAVPSRLLYVVRCFHGFVGPSSPRCMWLRTADLRGLVAQSCSRSLSEEVEDWRVLVFEGGVELRGVKPLRGAGDLQCAVLRLPMAGDAARQIALVAELARDRRLEMRAELAALIFFAQRAGLRLNIEDWMQVLQSWQTLSAKLQLVLGSCLGSGALRIPGSLGTTADAAHDSVEPAGPRAQTTGDLGGQGYRTSVSIPSGSSTAVAEVEGGQVVLDQMEIEIGMVEGGKQLLDQIEQLEKSKKCLLQLVAVAHFMSAAGFPQFVDVLCGISQPVATRGSSAAIDDIDEELAETLEKLRDDIEDVGVDRAIDLFIEEWT